MQNKCDDFKIEITNLIDLINTRGATSISEEHSFIFISAVDIINEMYNFARTNNLIENTLNPIIVDQKMHNDLLESMKDSAISENDKKYLIENFKQLLLDQLHVLYIIICKPIITDPISKLIIDKKIALNQANRFAKENNIFTDGIPFRKLSGGNINFMRKAYYKAYRDLYFMLKRK
jgi:hypothetical protein